MEEVLAVKDTANSQTLLFESMVYARTVEGKEYSYEVCQDEPFTQQLFVSVWVFMLHHFCRYNRR